MLVNARAGDWDGVAEIIRQRDTALMSLFSGAENASHLLAIESTLRAVQDANQSIIELGEETRKDISGKLNALSRGRDASLAYHSLQES